MPVPPVTTVRIDWDNDGDFADAYENLDGRVLHLSWTRGRSADFSAEATGAATIVLRNDDDLYTPDGASGPTAAQLVPGRPVHIYATYSATDYAQFYGFIERLAYDSRARTVTITCYDPLRRLAETDIVVPPNTFATQSARTMRAAVLGDFERGTRNLVSHNPSFETNTTGWTVSAGTLTRTATDAAPGAGSAYGAFVSGAADRYASATARMAPIYFNGETYRFSVYLKVASGSTTWKVGLGTTLGTGSEITVTPTTTWQRFTVTYTMTADQAASQANPLVAWVKSTASATVRIDAAMVTRGQALHPYADTGTGRWPTFVGNGDFEGSNAGVGWYGGFTNLISNPSFETNTTGWSIAGDAFVGASSSITRVAASPKFGTARADVVTAGVNDGVFFTITGTFVSGVAYNFGIWVRAESGTVNVVVGIGSQGTPADTDFSASPTLDTTFALVNGSWTPSSNRTDAHFYVHNGALGGSFRIDGAFVYRGDGAAIATYSDTGPGGGGSFVNTTLILANAGKYGYQSYYFETPATANSGKLYDFFHYGPYFVSGQQYILSLWVYPSSNMPYKVGIGANKLDGTWDEATTTGTATANTWTQITRTWTPSADRASTITRNVVAFIYQTDATARNVRVDGVRVIPGGTADDFEMTHWDLDMNGAAGEAGDRYLATASLSGGALSSLSTLNSLTLTRHWIRPETTPPFYTYVTEDRVTVAAKASVETFDNDLHDMTQADIDRASIVNIVPVVFTGGTEFYSDAASVEAYGVSPSAAIGGEAFFADRTTPDIIGPALVTRYKDPRARPEITVQNRWPSQLQRELNDMVTVNFTRLLISGREYLIQRLTTTVSDSGNLWTTVYALEEAP